MNIAVSLEYTNYWNFTKSNTSYELNSQFIIKKATLNTQSSLFISLLFYYWPTIVSSNWPSSSAPLTPLDSLPVSLRVKVRAKVSGIAVPLKVN